MPSGTEPTQVEPTSTDNQTANAGTLISETETAAPAAEQRTADVELLTKKVAKLNRRIKNLERSQGQTSQTQSQVSTPEPEPDSSDPEAAAAPPADPPGGDPLGSFKSWLES